MMEFDRTGVELGFEDGEWFVGVKNLQALSFCLVLMIVEGIEHHCILKKGTKRMQFMVLFFPFSFASSLCTFSLVVAVIQCFWLVGFFRVD